MSVRPGELRTPEDGLELASPTPALLERLEVARRLKPPGLHWREVWEQGRDAAVAAATMDGDLERARRLEAPREAPCRACFRKGRDAAVEALGYRNR